MSSVKLAATALLAMAFLTQVSGAAFAEDSNSDSDSNSQFILPTRPASPAPYERKVHTTRPKHHEGDEFQVAVPPMVITPDLDDHAASLGTGTGVGSVKPKQAFKVSPPKSGAGATKTVPDTAGKEQVIEPNSAAFDPTANEPIQMQNVHPTSKTPADVFIESAQIGVGAMAAGAVVLAVTAAMRGVRFRRQARTDFIYEVESQE
jgi:hypothetical protein